MPATVNKSGQESEVRQVVGPRDEMYYYCFAKQKHN